MIKIQLIFFVLLFQACNGSIESSSSSKNTTEKKIYAGGVKLISRSISDPRDKKTMKQKFYHLSPSSRLLTRIEGMRGYMNNIVISEEKRVYLVVGVVENIQSDLDERAFLEICPITSNWMMLATWEKAHPFPTSNGDWSNSGGDYAAYDCVRYDNSEIHSNEDNLAYFDVTSWYIYYVQSRANNFGLMIKSDEGITIIGDEDSNKAPHFVWQER